MKRTHPSIVNQMLRVLIIEDDEPYRMMLAKMAGSLNCEATQIGSAIDALELLKHESVDVIMLDLHLPRMNGLEFLSRLRERDLNTPVIVLTGVGTLEAAQSAIRSGVTDFLTKPCHLGNLESALERARRNLAVQRLEPDLPDEVFPPSRNAPSEEPVKAMAEIEREAILSAIKRNNGNRSAAAVELGISRRTLHYRLAEYQKDGLVVE
ncbi:MAG TPA: response regulator [Phycisphaerales bacterium]|nr:response regulator [Phycisphaerales bacterium]